MENGPAFMFVAPITVKQSTGLWSINTSRIPRPDDTKLER
jgi:hypothetical protein